MDECGSETADRDVKSIPPQSMFVKTP